MARKQMNIILIVSDTLRRDHLGCYGNNWISTPNIDKFAKKIHSRFIKFLEEVKTEERILKPWRAFEKN